jgi:hypothetical protein
MQPTRGTSRQPSRIVSIAYVLVTLALVYGGVSLARRVTTDPDVALCRRIFAQLAGGRLSVAPHVNWGALKALEVDVGATYKALKESADQGSYRHAFIIGFGQGFRGAGSRPSQFVNWRVVARDGQQVTVAADFPKHRKTLLLVLSGSGKRQLEAIQWLGAEGAGE